MLFHDIRRQFVRYIISCYKETICQACYFTECTCCAEYSPLSAIVFLYFGLKSNKTHLRCLVCNRSNKKSTVYCFDKMFVVFKYIYIFGNEITSLENSTRRRRRKKVIQLNKDAKNIKDPYQA